jgi:hypothetical protein
MTNNDEVIHEGIFDYGTPYAEIMPTIIPYKDPTDLENKWGIKAAYNFIGYTRVKGSNNIAVMPEIVAIEDTYYAVFEEIQDITTVVHPEWFEYFEYAYDRERGAANTNASNTELSNIITEAEILKYNSGY